MPTRLTHTDLRLVQGFKFDLRSSLLLLISSTSNATRPSMQASWRSLLTRFGIVSELPLLSLTRSLQGYFYTLGKHLAST